MNVVESDGLGRRYGATWALRDCTLAIPEGHLVAVVGPNGAGKSTMLNIIVGLTAPTTGDVTVLGGAAVGSSAALDDIAFVAQDMPLYRQLSVADMVHLTRNLNRGFDDAYARRRLDELGISTKSKAGKLSGGQQSQLALTLALARRPRLLVLDEPTSRLDPLARHDFMATVMSAMADEGVSVLLSSHALAELERVADYLVLVTGGVVRLAGTVDELAAQHRLMTGRVGQPAPAGWQVIQSSEAGSQRHLLVRLGGSADGPPDSWESRAVGVEELVLGYLRESATPAAFAPVEVGR
jgi:ABC-2 type transport system ATP-binding protein